MHQCRLTWGAPAWVVLFPGPRKLEEREEAEGVPVHVVVWVELRFLTSRSVARAVRETQMIGNLPMEKKYWANNIILVRIHFLSMGEMFNVLSQRLTHNITRYWMANVYLLKKNKINKNAKQICAKCSQRSLKSQQKMAEISHQPHRTRAGSH